MISNKNYYSRFQRKEETISCTIFTILYIYINFHYNFLYVTNDLDPELTLDIMHYTSSHQIFHLMKWPMRVTRLQMWINNKKVCYTDISSSCFFLSILLGTSLLTRDTRNCNYFLRALYIFDSCKLLSFLKI